MDTVVDRRKAWRAQEEALVARWNSAVQRQNDVLAEIALAAGAPSDELTQRADSARAELEAVRRKVAKLKVEFNSGKRY